MANRRILYVSGEESARQLKMRAERIAVGGNGNAGNGNAGNGNASSNGTAVSMTNGNTNLSILCETSLENIFASIKETVPELVVIDSIQTISSDTVDSSPGSVTQVRECAAALLRFAKSSGVPVVLIGHINKEGTLAGP